MAERNRGIIERLVDWFTIEVTEPGEDQAAGSPPVRDAEWRDVAPWPDPVAQAEDAPARTSQPAPDPWPAANGAGDFSAAYDAAALAPEVAAAREASLAPAALGGVPPESSPRAGGRRNLLERAVDWLTVEVPDDAGAEGAASWSGATDTGPRAPRPHEEGALAALGLLLGSLVTLGATAAAMAREGWLAATDAVVQGITGSPPRRSPARRTTSSGSLRPAPAVRARPQPAGPAWAPLPRRLSAARVGVLLAALLAVGLGVHLIGHLPTLRPPVDGPSVPTASHIAVAQADAAAAAAEAAAQAAKAAGQRIAAQLTAARQAAQQVTALSAPTLARQPSAKDPAQPLATLQLLRTQALGAVGTIGSDVTLAERGASAAASVSAASGPAAAAASAAKSALATAQGAAGQIAALLPPAQQAAAAWHRVHTAPPGSLGVTIQDPPATWGIHGCEVLTVPPGGAGQQLGLTGAGGFTRPVGDIITLVKDATDANAVWPTANCAALQAAMAQTRAGDRITVAYEHRATMDLVLGFWLSDSGTVVLGQGGGGQSVCPLPLTGRTGPGGTVPLTLAVSGPAGTRHGVHVTLEPAGAATFFPNALLRALGYKPYQSEAGSGIVPGSQATVYLYNVPGSSLVVADGGASVALADGMLSVVGIPGSTAASLGPQILNQGAQLTVSGAAWTLTPPCH